jgi:hypothetical protein
MSTDRVGEYQDVCEEVLDQLHLAIDKETKNIE